ncbi:MAG TPA: hypothetical protein VMH81_26620 [Bryobacteraceae bacterium]|nr:hypothetical protein [Bryobacteraceae bacterium]
MRLQYRCGAAALLLLAATVLVAADAPWVGKWKFNPAKSDLGQTTVTFAQTASGEMQLIAEGQSYTFKTDGKDYPAIFGYTASWRQIDANTWETTDKLNGKVVSVDTTKLSADGKTLTMESKGKRPNGEPFDDTTTYQRASGGPGLPGKWKTQNLKVSSPELMEIAAAGPGADGITLTMPAEKASCKGAFDGKEYPFSGPQMPPGFTATFKHIGPKSFEMTLKNKGKPAYVSTFTVSDDGKTLSETGSAVGIDEKYKYVYDRQPAS